MEKVTEAYLAQLYLALDNDIKVVEEVVNSKVMEQRKILP